MAHINNLVSRIIVLIPKYPWPFKQWPRYVFTSLLAGATFSQLLYELMNSATSIWALTDLGFRVAGLGVQLTSNRGKRQQEQRQYGCGNK